jgi:hypothetical protein
MPKSRRCRTRTLSRRLVNQRQAGAGDRSRAPGRPARSLAIAQQEAVARSAYLTYNAGSSEAEMPLCDARGSKLQMANWWSKIRDQSPNPGTVGDLIGLVEALPGLKDWEPRDEARWHWLDVAHLGFVLQCTTGLDDVAHQQQTIAREIIAGGRPAAQTLAELSAAALCATFDAVEGRRLPRSMERSADWRMIWADGLPVDLKVISASEKPLHIERQAFATELAHALHRSDRRFDLLVHLADVSSNDDRKAVMLAASSIQAGEAVDQPGRWRLCALPINRGVGVVLPAGAEDRPDWWSRDDVCRLVLVGMLAGPETVRAPAQVRVGFGVPYVSYVNPVRKKAQLSQGEAGLPFVIAVDVGNLPGAFREIPRVVLPYLQRWTHVSGILLFHDLRGIDRIGWSWRFVSNQFAANPIPSPLSQGRADLPTAMDSYRLI